jgi:hypothetical protein
MAGPWMTRINPRLCNRWQARDIDVLTAFGDPRIHGTDLISAKDRPVTPAAPADFFLRAEYSSHLCKADNFLAEINITVSALSNQKCQCLRFFYALFPDAN